MSLMEQKLTMMHFYMIVLCHYGLAHPYGICMKVLKDLKNLQVLMFESVLEVLGNTQLLELLIGGREWVKP